MFYINADIPYLILDVFPQRKGIISFKKFTKAFAETI